MSTGVTSRRRVFGRTQTTIPSEAATPEIDTTASESDLVEELSVASQPTQAQRTRRVATIIAVSLVAAAITSSAATVLARRYMARRAAKAPQE